jgi:hypothetical protein
VRLQEELDATNRKVKGLTIMVDSLVNGNRREDVWLDK